MNQRTGAVARTKVAPVTDVLGALRGNNLFAYDGYGTNPSYASVIYTQMCIVEPCTKYGLADFRANAKTGALKLFSPAGQAFIRSVSISGDRMAVLESPASGPGLIVSSLLIVHKTGNLKPVISSYRLVDSDNDPIGGNDVAAGAGVGIDGLNNNGVASVGVLTGGAIDDTAQQFGGTALAFIPHALLEAEIGPTFGPFLQLISPDGLGSDGGIDLTLPPFKLGGGAEDDPHFPENIFQLGAGIYIGVYLDPLVQATDGVGGKGLVIDKKPTVAGTFSDTSLTGFLKPTATKATIAVKHSGKTLVVSGTVKGGASGLLVTVTLSVEKGKKFVSVQHKAPALNSKLHYSASLSKPKASVCRATVSYKGNAATAGSSAHLTFAC